MALGDRPIYGDTIETVDVGNWHIDILRRGALFVRPGERATTSWCETVTIYRDGSLGFDFPERIPEYVKVACRRLGRRARGVAA